MANAPINLSVKPSSVLLYNPNPASSTHAGFFCRKELLMDRRNGALLRFRLGSIDYVDRLEGKRQ